MSRSIERGQEWLEADGLGGFASGTATGIRTRRYHALLLAAARPPAGRMVLVNGCEVWLEREGERVPLSTQHYAPGLDHPDGTSRLAAFTAEPWPTWTYRLPDGRPLVHEVFVTRDAPRTVLTWRGAADGTLCVRPLLSGRDYHALHHENQAFDFHPESRGRTLVWRPYPDVPAVAITASGAYQHDPVWYRNFLYQEERARGLDHVEDLASPGVWRFDLAAGEATLVLEALTETAGRADDAEPSALRARETARRAAFPSPLHRAADAYLVRRGAGRTVIAGYPWFGDWGRDSFIALRGLCLTTGRLEDARGILLAWADEVSAGMLPNRFVEAGDAPEFNSVDAALWYVVAVDAFRRAAAERGLALASPDAARLREAVHAILDGYARGTRHGIRLDDDGLLAAGAPGLQLTWMDAKVGDWVVTPRIGKPVEIQALWLNALSAGAERDVRWAAALARGRAAFERRFWLADAGYLADVVDVDHVPGRVDPALRPNQIFAVGGLPLPALRGTRARQVVDRVERDLWTPIGLRSLAPDDPRYARRYAGGPRERDGAYHQGTVWPWLLGPFVDAWLRVRRHAAPARREARARFVAPLLAHVAAAGLGHVSEVADGEAPHTPGGCPFQAWSVAEALRLAEEIAPAESGASARARPGRRRPARVGTGVPKRGGTGESPAG